MKKILAAIGTVCMICTMILPTKAADLPPPTLDDAIDILMHIVGLHELSIERVWLLDFDGDGILTTADALAILKGVVGLDKMPIMSYSLSAQSNPAPTPLSDEAELQIKKDCLDYFYSNWSDYPIDQIQLHNLGIYGESSESVALMLYLGGTQMPWREEVAGYTFGYPAGRSRVYVWNNGTFYTLSAGGTPACGAYETGLLTDDDIGNIHYHWSRNHFNPFS
jgi:hypothetical protein